MVRAAERTQPTDDPFADQLGMHLLADHVPLTLLVDLAVRSGPTSEELIRTEVAPLDWLVLPD
jgi:hypothetical protein